MGSDPFGGYEGYCQAMGFYNWKVKSEKGILLFVTEDEADACIKGINLCGFKAEKIKESVKIK